MAAFTPANPLTWGVGDVVTSAQLNKLDLDHVKSPNFDDGGATYNPVALIQVGGAGIQFNTQVLVSSRSITRVDASTPTTASATWDLSADGTLFQVADAAGKTFHPLRLPHGQELTSVTMRVIGGPGHAGLPAQMPALELVSMNLSNITAVIGTAIDGSASVVTYEAAHDITIGGLTETVDLTTKRYFLALSGERNANYVSGLRAIAPLWTCTVTYVPDA